MNKISIVITALVAVALIIGGAIYSKTRPSIYDGFAQCLKDKGAIFYGAFWCPHCQATKAMFGNAARYLPYVECSNPDQRSQTQICIDKGIHTYPTWIFPDGSKLEGERSLKELAEKTKCELPKGSGAGNATEVGIGSSTEVSQ